MRSTSRLAEEIEISKASASVPSVHGPASSTAAKARSCVKLALPGRPTLARADTVNNARAAVSTCAASSVNASPPSSIVAACDGCLTPTVCAMMRAQFNSRAGDVRRVPTRQAVA